MSLVSPQRCRQYSSTRSSGGRLFHTRGPATAKFLAPMAVRVRGTYRVLVSADRSGRRPATDDTRTQSSVRWDGARPWRHLKTISASLNRTRCTMGSQWSSFSTGVMWSNFLDGVTTRAAEFCAVCSFLSSRPLTLYNTPLPYIRGRTLYAVQTDRRDPTRCSARRYSAR